MPPCLPETKKMNIIFQIIQKAAWLWQLMKEQITKAYRWATEPPKEISDPVYERMLKLEFGPTLSGASYSVRVWVSCDERWQPSEDEARSVLNSAALEARFLQAQDPKEIAEHLSGISFVAAVEVLRADGCGILIYPDWP